MAAGRRVVRIFHVPSGRSCPWEHDHMIPMELFFSSKKMFGSFWRHSGIDFRHYSHYEGKSDSLRRILEGKIMKNYWRPMNSCVELVPGIQLLNLTSSTWAPTIPVSDLEMCRNPKPRCLAKNFLNPPSRLSIPWIPIRRHQTPLDIARH